MDILLWRAIWKIQDVQGKITRTISDSHPIQKYQLAYCVWSFVFCRKYTNLINTLVYNKQGHRQELLVLLRGDQLSTVLWLIVKFMSKALLHCLEAIVLYLQCVVPRRRKQEEGTVVPKGNEIACCGFDFRSNFLATWKLKIREYSTGARME